MLVLGGGPLHATAATAAAPGTLVVAADSGVDHALAVGLAVHHVVGDLDSASPGAVAAAVAAGATIHRHQADKDATDSELALDLALDLVLDRTSGVHDADRPLVLVVGGGAERLDHLLADVAQLVSPRTAPVEVTAVLGPATCTVVRALRPRELAVAPGEQVSLLAPAGPARGVTTTGLRWPLLDAVLGAGSTRGISNEAVGSPVIVSVGDGVLLVVQPGSQAPPVPPRRMSPNPSPGSDRGR